MRHSVIIIFLSLVVISSAAQSKRKKSKEDAPVAEQPSSLEPYYPKKTYGPKPEKKKKKQKTTYDYDARERFDERMNEVNKQARRIEKESEKPQNSDPMYFGHKRPPKKRPVNKMKYCKVCGIRH